MNSLKHKLANILIQHPISVFDTLNWNARYIEYVKKNGAVGIASCRTNLYRDVYKTLSSPFDYLEFGVYQGESMREWLSIEGNSASRFYGFDTFVGLPEDWLLNTRGSFTTDGRVPDIHDSRVHFVKGLFQDTVPGFLKTYVPQRQLVIHIDSDLLTSAQYVLAKLDPLLGPGSVILFDEFCCVEHEFCAWVQYLAAFRRKAVFLGGTNDQVQAAFRISA